MADEEDTGVKYVFQTADGTVRKQGSRGYTGEACASYPNGDVYTGHFVEGIRGGGRGCYMYSNGEKYEGAWENNVKHGLGTMSYNGKGEY